MASPGSTLESHADYMTHRYYYSVVKLEDTGYLVYIPDLGLQGTISIFTNHKREATKLVAIHLIHLFNKQSKFPRGQGHFWVKMRTAAMLRTQGIDYKDKLVHIDCIDITDSIIADGLKHLKETGYIFSPSEHVLIEEDK